MAMGKAKRALTAVVLLVVIIAIAIFLGRRFGCGGVKPPAEVAGRPVEKIDLETLEVIGLPAQRWKSLGAQDNKFKNPKTGKYTMVNVATCKKCGKKIPHPSWQFPPIPTERGSHTVEEIDRIIAEALARRAEILRDYKCPICGEPNPVAEEIAPPGAEAAGGAPGALGGR